MSRTCPLLAIEAVPPRCVAPSVIVIVPLSIAFGLPALFNSPAVECDRLGAEDVAVGSDGVTRSDDLDPTVTIALPFVESTTLIVQVTEACRVVL